MPPSGLLKYWSVAGSNKLNEMHRTLIKKINIDGTCAKALGNATAGFEFIQRILTSSPIQRFPRAMQNRANCIDRVQEKCEVGR